MRKFLLLALLASCSSSGAPTVTSRYEDGRLASTGGHVRELRSGPWTDYFPSGRKQCEGRYENDVQAGLWTYWFENGQKEMEGRFEDERREGEWTSWYENGSLRAVGRFERGFEEGPWRFYDRSGAVEHEGTFELGRPVLRWTYYGPDGTVHETGDCFEGARVGRWTTQSYPVPKGCELVEERFPDSTLKRTGFLRDGTPSGRWNTFHPGGKLRLECTFRDGSPDGSAHAWREDGSLLARGTLEKGCIAGTWTFRRGDAEEQLDSKAARPRPSFAGDWSPANSADLPGWTAVETWIAEASSPLQPAPIPSSTAPEPTAAESRLAPEDATGIPARAQPWTEYERRVLPSLVKLYGSGIDEYEGRVSLRESPSTPPAAVAKPADLVGRKLPLTRFSTADGGAIDLDDFAGKQDVLVTILRGFGGQVCVYCTAQTKALADFADRFAALGTKVVIVFPGPASGLDAFREAYRRTFSPADKLPFDLLYDTDLALTRALHIEDDMAVPTSLLLDKTGVVRWCRVAKDHADRPSAQEILARIQELRKHER
jgi:antitoxin component YwqK of YwqJK toxin-antitoxin module/peroxiredoxin